MYNLYINMNHSSPTCVSLISPQ